MDDNRFATRLPQAVLKSALQKGETLIEAQDRAAHPHHRFPNAAMQNAMSGPLQLPYLPVLLYDALPEHFPGRDLLTKRFLQ